MSEREEPKRGYPKASVLVLVCLPLLISLSGVAAAILHISDVAVFAELVVSSFIHACSSVGTRSDRQTQFLSNCVLLCFRFFFASFFFGWVGGSFSEYIIYG